MNIGLTGGIACGKTTVASSLVRRGALLIDADLLAREVVEPGSPILEQVTSHFGQGILHPDGSLNRKALGEKVFRDKASRKLLESILHPAIRLLMEERMNCYEKEYPDKLIVAVVPLLYESGFDGMFAEVMVVYVPQNVQLERLMERDKLTEEQALSRIRAQMSIEEKKKRADILIENQGDLLETERQLDEFWKRKGLT